MRLNLGGDFPAFTLEPLRQFMIESDTGSRLPQRRLLPGEGSDAFISWGDASRFITPQLQSPINSSEGHSLVVRNLNKEEVPEQAEPAAIFYSEGRRVTSVIRVENPRDRNQFVDIERIEEIYFADSNGVVHVFQFNNL